MRASFGRSKKKTCKPGFNWKSIIKYTLLINIKRNPKIYHMGPLIHVLGEISRYSIIFLPHKFIIVFLCFTYSCAIFCSYYSEFPEDLMTYCSKCRPGIKGCPDSVDSIRTTTYSTISRKRNRTLLSHPVNEFLTSVVPSFSKKVTTTPPNNVKPWVAPSANRIENATVTSNAGILFEIQLVRINLTGQW